jgi:hypothetical protein
MNQAARGDHPGALRSLERAIAEADVSARAAETAAQRELEGALKARDETEVRLRRAALDSARARLEDVLERIQREAKCAANVVYPEAATLASIRAALREGEALVVYGLLSRHAMALVVTAGSARVVRLGGTPEITRACEALDSLWGPRAGRRGRRRIPHGPRGFRMRIPADLVVLSACETGRGKAYRAEGIVGLTRAFMFAGSPRVIVSLWRVDDAATRALMEAFYRRWKEGAPAALALRGAQEEVRKRERWSHPRYWAAWTLWGLPD